MGCQLMQGSRFLKLTMLIIAMTLAESFPLSVARPKMSAYTALLKWITARYDMCTKI